MDKATFIIDRSTGEGYRIDAIRRFYLTRKQGVLVCVLVIDGDAETTLVSRSVYDKLLERSEVVDAGKKEVK